jgi:Phage tail assembly chaperone proteins, E, or 41 or 14
MDWQTTEKKLQYPITVDGALIEKVTFRAPNGKALRRIEALEKQGLLARDEGEASTMEGTMLLIEALSDLPEGASDELHIEDITELSGVVAPFLEGFGDKPKAP